MLAHSAAVVEALDLPTTRNLAHKRDASQRRTDDLHEYLDALDESTSYVLRQAAWWEVHGSSATARLAHWSRDEFETRNVIDLTLTAFMAADDAISPSSALSSEYHDVDEVVATAARALTYLAGADDMWEELR